MKKELEVFVITNVESGWDCVRGVYRNKRDAYARILDEEYDDNLSEQELDSLVDNTSYIIHEETLN